MEHQTRIIKNAESVATFRAKVKKFYLTSIPINKLCKLRHCRTRDFSYSISIIIVVHMRRSTLYIQHRQHLGSIHNLSRGWAMMISLFFPFIFWKPPLKISGVFFWPPTPIKRCWFIKGKYHSPPPPPPAHKYNMSNSPLAISKPCDRYIELY